MTLGKYGLRYKDWSNKGLKQFAQQRNVSIPHTDRRVWIRTLREKDQEANIRFLDFPPEIRNPIYGELLTPKSDGKDPESFFCHPAILRSCRQIYAEAADIIHITARIPISLHLLSRYNDRAGAQDDYWVQICFNGRLLEYRKDTSGADVRNDHPSRECRAVRERAGYRQMNLALFKTCVSLIDSPNLQGLHVDVLYRLADNQVGVKMLSPLPTLAAWIEKVTYGISTRAQFVSQSLHESVACFPRVHALKAEVNLLIQLYFSPPRVEIAYGDTLVSLDSRHCLAALRQCGRIITSCQERWGCVFAGPQELRHAITSIEQNLDRADLNRLGTTIIGFAAELRTLKEMRAAKHARAGRMALA